MISSVQTIRSRARPQGSTRRPLAARPARSTLLALPRDKAPDFRPRVPRIVYGTSTEAPIALRLAGGEFCPSTGRLPGQAGHTRTGRTRRDSTDTCARSGCRGHWVEDSIDSRWRGERRVVTEDRPLQRLQLLARLEPEVVTQDLPRIVVRVECLCLATGPVERNHQVAA